MKNSSIYFLNIFLKIYLAIINICLVNNLRFNMYFEYNISFLYSNIIQITITLTFLSQRNLKNYITPLKIIQKKHPI
ncbi:hypothetical protein FHY71_12585 [Bacillus tropicus]|uniref:Uncharacterized protein n=1 Tax=Bacillus tropicus TaxID=2026188 RepID=A0A5C5A7D1_9BACI|nr:hypothetical protein FHY71_12585 [Bacillus tropicus]